MFIFRLNWPLFVPAAVLLTECPMNHVQPILSIVFSTIFNLLKGEFFSKIENLVLGTSSEKTGSAAFECHGVVE
jgi:hypothetical protein